MYLQHSLNSSTGNEDWATPERLDKDSLLQLLKEKENDLMMAADIGKQLLEKNSALEQQLAEVEKEKQQAEENFAEVKTKLQRLEQEREYIVGKVDNINEELDSSKKECDLWKTRFIQQTKEMENLATLKTLYEEEKHKSLILKEELDKLKSESSKRTMMLKDINQRDQPPDKTEEKKIQTFKLKIQSLESQHEKLLLEIESLRKENERLQDIEEEKDKLVKVMDSLVKANKLLQQEQDEYARLLYDAKQQIKHLEQENNVHKTITHDNSVAELMIGEVDKQLEEMIKNRASIVQPESEPQNKASIATAAEISRENKAVMTDIDKGNDIGVSTDVFLVESRSFGVQTEFVQILDSKAETNAAVAEETLDAINPVEKELQNTIDELQRRLTYADEERTRLEQALSLLEKEMKESVQSLSKELSGCKLQNRELEESNERLLLARKDRLERTCAVLDQVWEFREKFIYAHTTVRSKYMSKFLKPQEMIDISNAVIDQLLSDAKKRLNEEGEAKMYGKSEEWVCQIFELLIQSCEMLRKQNSLVLQIRSLNKNLGDNKKPSSPFAVTNKEDKPWWKLWN